VIKQNVTGPQHLCSLNAAIRHQAVEARAFKVLNNSERYVTD